MKRQMIYILLLMIAISTFYTLPANAQVEEVTVPVSVLGEYQNINHWEEATYTCTVTDGIPADNGILSNGKYTFNYFPLEGQIKNIDSISAFKFVEGNSEGPIVIPTSIDSFSIGETTYEAKSITLYAAEKDGIFRDNLSANVDIVIPEGVEEIPDSVFSLLPNENTQTRFILPSTIKSIGKFAFLQASKKALFTDVNLPKGLTHIGEKAFGNCQFENVVIPAGVTVIENTAFGYNNKLKNVTFEGEVKTIDASAFREANMETITFKGKMAPESIADTAFADIKNEYTVYYPADGVGYDDPEFQSKFSGTPTFVPQSETPPPAKTTCKLIDISKTETVYNIEYEIELGEDDNYQPIEESKNIIALYNGESLVAVKTVDADQTVAEIETDKHITEAKIFVWKDAVTIKPLCESHSLTIS